jgi:hypothetical protein
MAKSPMNVAPKATGNVDVKPTRKPAHKANTPEERAERFSKLATMKTRRIVRDIRATGDLITGYAVFNEAQAEKFREIVTKEAENVYGAMIARLQRGTTAKDLDITI